MVRLVNRRVGSALELTTQDGHVSSKVSALDFKNTGWSCMSSKVNALEFKTQDGHVSNKVRWAHWNSNGDLEGVTPTCAYALYTRLGFRVRI